MTLLEEKSSYRGDNKIENWRSFDNYLNLIEDAPAQSNQFCGFRKSKSDSELSKCTCASDMGSQLSRSKSFHSFEMLEGQNAIKKPSLPDTSDYSEDDYQPLDSTDDELQTQDEASQSTQVELNRQSTDHVLDSRSIENQTSDESETQSGGLNSFLSQTNFIAGCSKNNKCASLSDSSFDKPHPHSELNDNECENIVGSIDALKTDSILNCMTLPKIKSDPRSSAVLRSLRTAADRGSAGNKNLDEISEAQLRRSLKALKSSRSLLHQQFNDESAVAPNELTHEAVPQCASDPDVFNVLLTEQQLSADLDRPRQYGRRSNPVRISSFAIESSDNGAAVSRYFIIVDQLMRAN